MKNIVILKILIFVSFLLLTPLNEHGVPLVGTFLLFLYQFISDLFTMPLDQVFWEGFLVIPIVGTLITIMLCKFYKQRYLLLFCIFALFIFIGHALGSSYNKEYFHIGFLWFIVPLTIFVISSILLLYFNFKKLKIEIA